MNITDLEKLIKSNIKRLDKNDYGIKRLPTYNVTRRNGWDTSDEKQEKINHLEYPESLWIESRTYDPTTGIMVIYFKPIPTNAKPPVVLGVNGDPIEWGFIHSFDNGIQSTTRNIRPNSQGAFYKKYIQQYQWVTYNGVMLQVPNKKRVVEAVNLEELQSIDAEIKKMSKKTPKHKRMVNSFYNIPNKSFAQQLTVNHLEREAKEYLMGKLQNSLGKKGWVMDHDQVKNRIISKIAPKKLLAKVKGYEGALSEIKRTTAKKGVVSLTTKSGRTALKAGARRGAVRGSGKVMVGEASANEIIAAGTAAAPETSGLSVLIAGGVVVTMSVFRNHKTTQKTKSIVGSEGLGAINILAFKKVLKDDLALHVKRQGIKNLVKKGFKSTENINWRKQEILNNRTNVKELWRIAKNDASKSYQSWTGKTKK